MVDVAVLDRVVEDRGEGVDQLADRGGRERDGSATASVADVGACVERGTQLARLAQLAGLEGEAQVRVDRVEAAVPEERQQVACKPPAVVADRVRRDPLVADRAVDLRLQPPGGVDVEGRDGAVLGRRRERGRRLRWRPHADADAREDVPQLRACAGLVPPAAMDPAEVRRIEASRRDPGVRVVAHLAAGLDTAPAELLAGIPTPTP